jgi:translation initiation factor 2 subunit 1
VYAGYIDLSKRRASPEDIIKAEDRYQKAKAVHSIIKHVSARLKVPMQSLYQRIAWPLYKRYGHAFDAFTLAVTDPESVFKGLEMTEAETSEIKTFIALKMTPQPLRIRADIQVSCVGYEGVEAVRSALVRVP